MLISFIKSILGFHDVGNAIDADTLRSAANRLKKKKDMYRPQNLGIFVLQVGGKELFFCRTRTGWIFPSLFALELSDGAVTVPHTIRLIFGYTILAFLVLYVFVLTVFSIQTLANGENILLVALFFAIFTPVLFLSAKILGHFERYLILAGFRKYLAAK